MALSPSIQRPLPRTASDYLARNPLRGTFLRDHPVPSAAQVKALIRSHADGDEQRFYSIALQVAAQAARQGHNRFAIELRDLVDRAKAGMERQNPGQVTRPVPMVQPRGELAGLLTAVYPKTRLAEMALDPATHDRIKRVLTE